MAPSDLDFLVFFAELQSIRRDLVLRGKPTLIIVHSYSCVRSPKGCIPGEEVRSAWLTWDGGSHQLPLSTPHLLLLDYIARHSRIPQNARQIEEGLNEDHMRFYLQHASNAPSRTAVPPRTTRTAVPKQIERIREQLGLFFKTEKIQLDPKGLLRSLPTSSREVRYSVDAIVRIEHSH